MSEETEVPEQKEHHPAKQSSGSSGAFLATVIALVAAGGTFYLWQQQQVQHKETLALQQSIARLLNVVEERHTSQLQRIDALAQHHHPDTEEQLGRIEALVQDLRGRLGQERNEWAVAEVEYLLRIAEHRLTLEHDKEAALAALRQARERLASQDQDVYQPVLQQIDADAAKLAAVSLPDRNRIAAELATLSAAVQNWPFASRDNATAAEPASAAIAPDEQAANGKGWRQMLDKVWRDIKGLVTIRHNGEVARPLLEPEQRYFLQQNLQLKLEAARLALLSGNSQAYHDSLTEASTWLQRYFDTSATPVREAQSAIEQLSAIDLEPRLPKLGNSIELLQQAAMQVQSRQEAIPEPQPPAPAAPAKEIPEAVPTEDVPSSGEVQTAPAETQALGNEPQATTQPEVPAQEESVEPSLPPEQPATDVPAQPQGQGL